MDAWMENIGHISNNVLQLEALVEVKNNGIEDLLMKNQDQPKMIKALEWKVQCLEDWEETFTSGDMVEELVNNATSLDHTVLEVCQQMTELEEMTKVLVEGETSVVHNCLTINIVNLENCLDQVEEYLGDNSGPSYFTNQMNNMSSVLSLECPGVYSVEPFRMSGAGCIISLH